MLLPPPKRLCFTRRQSVCLSVSNFTKELLGGSSWKFYRRWRVSLDKEELKKLWNSSGAGIPRLRIRTGTALAEVCTLKMLSVWIRYDFCGRLTFLFSTNLCLHYVTTVGKPYCLRIYRMGQSKTYYIVYRVYRYLTMYTSIYIVLPTTP